jgi:2-dehydropantoate 2-reductase
MRVIVIGAGAMGGLFGAKLWTAGHDVLLYDIWSEHVEVVRSNGLAVEELDGAIARYRVPITDELPATIAAAELILLEVKSYDTFAALAPIRDQLEPGTFVLSLQNGVGNYEEMHRALPDHERLIIGTSAHGSNVVGPGHVRRTGIGPTEIGDPGELKLVPFDLVPIADAFTEAGIEMNVVEYVHAAVWAKLAANASINPITALTGLRNGEILQDPDLVSTYTQIVEEMLAVMDAKGIPRIKDDYVAYAGYVMEITSTSYSSMLQDIRFRRRTEIDAINGAITRFGQELGIPTPMNQTIAALVRNRQRDYLEEGRAAF